MRITILSLALLLCLSVSAQDEGLKDKLQLHISLGHYPASLVVPSFSTIHPGLNAGVNWNWNKSLRHQFFQSGNIGYFYHRDLQKAIQLYTEFGYNLKFKNGFAVTPLAIGGGYVMSIADIESVKWDETTQQYEVEKFSARHNWMISLGASISMETQWSLFKNRKMTFFADYRIQVQGIFVEETVPVIAYSPLRLGLSIPLKENSKG